MTSGRASHMHECSYCVIITQVLAFPLQKDSTVQRIGNFVHKSLSKSLGEPASCVGQESKEELCPNMSTTGTRS